MNKGSELGDAIQASFVETQFSQVPVYMLFFFGWLSFSDPVLEGGNPVLALLLGLSLGTSSCNWRMLCPLLMMMLGVLATIHGELFLSYLGLALLVMAILIEQFLGDTCPDWGNVVETLKIAVF